MEQFFVWEIKHDLMNPNYQPPEYKFAYLGHNFTVKFEVGPSDSLFVFELPKISGVFQISFNILNKSLGFKSIFRTFVFEYDENNQIRKCKTPFTLNDLSDENGYLWNGNVKIKIRIMKLESNTPERKLLLPPKISPVKRSVSLSPINSISSLKAIPIIDFNKSSRLCESPKIESVSGAEILSPKVVEPSNKENRNISFNYDVNSIMAQIENGSAESESQLNTSAIQEEQTSDDSDAEKIVYSGLVNQGCTCYMNSMLQALYHLPIFRKYIYQMDTTSDKADCDNIPLNFQRLFATMQISKAPCSTKNLTKSFGWDLGDILMQHDIQEFCRVVIDNIETKMNEQPKFKGKLSELFKGQYKTFIRCRNVDYESSTINDFYDLTMIVKGSNSLEESLDKYVEQEPLIGDNQYKTEDYGLQDADMGTEFISFPPVLYFHLSRFEYNYQTGQMEKLNSYFEFPEVLNLSKYLKNDNNCMYQLFGVLVHSGNTSSGHYYAFLRTTPKDEWYCFNDSRIEKVSKQKAINDNFGSAPDSFQREYSAYMLIYIKESEINKLYETVSDDLIPLNIQQYVTDYLKKIEEVKKERYQKKFFLYNEKDLLAGIKDGLMMFAKSDNLPVISMEEPFTLNDIIQQIGEKLKVDPKNIDIYEIRNVFPKYLMKINDVSNLLETKTHNIFVYIRKDDEEYNENTTLLFIFYYIKEKLQPFELINISYYSNCTEISELKDEFKVFNLLPDGTNVQIFRHISSYEVEEIKQNGSLQDLGIQETQILILQTDSENDESFININEEKNDCIPKDYLSALKTRPSSCQKCIEYLLDKFQVKVNLIVENEKKPLHETITFPRTITISSFISFIKFVFQLGYINSILLFKPDQVKTKILDDNSLFEDFCPKYSVDKIYAYAYTHLTTSMFKDTLRIKCYMSMNGRSCYTKYPKTIFIPNNLKVNDFINETVKNNQYLNGKNIRLLQIKDMLIYKQLALDDELINVKNPVRLEIVPEDQIELRENERLISCFIYPRNPTSDFLFKVIKDEPFSETKERLMKFMKLQKEDFSKYNFYLKDIYCTKEHISDSTFLFDKVKYNNDNFIYLRIDSSQIVKQEKIHSSSVKLYN